MGRKLEDIFNECYDRVRSGEPMQSVLASYPEHAVELERLLRTAFDIGRRASYIQPRPEFRYWTGLRLQGAYQYAQHQKRSPIGRGFNWSTAWAVALTALIIVVVSGIGTAAAASDAMPDEALYPVKLATEQARLALTFSESAKAELYAKLAEKRVIELETMAEQGKIDLAAATAEKLASHLESASTVLAKITEAPQATPAVTATTTEPVPTVTAEPAPEQPPQETAPTTATPAAESAAEQKAPEKPSRAERPERIKTSLETSTARSLTVLQKAMYEASPEAKPKLEKAIERIHEKGRWKREGNPGGSPADRQQNGAEEEDTDSGQQEPSVDRPSSTTQPSDNHYSPSWQSPKERNRGR